MKAAIYLRVSTREQTTENQRRQLEEVAKARGWEIVATYEDAGVSGAKSRDKRPQFDQALKDAVKGRYKVLMSWSVDRLGRSLQDLIAGLDDLRASGVELYLHQQAVDTSTPSGKAMYQMLGVFAEFEREMIRERVNAGLARAKAQGKRLGRPKVHCDAEAIAQAVQGGMSIRMAAQTFAVSPSKVQRILSSLGGPTVSPK